MHNKIIHFVHGKESGPWGSKINYLANIAKELGFEYESLDYSQISAKEERVNKLLNALPKDKKIILVGSSMGGWVSTRMAEIRDVEALFLMAPAIAVKDYSDLTPRVRNSNIFVVHGWHDDVIPVDCSIRFTNKMNASLLIVDDDHRLKEKLEIIGSNFRNFLLNIK
jgi:predicted esterase YcpF (UPF0227 family)